MRRFWAVLTLFSAVSCGSALAGPEDDVFEYRLLDDSGLEIVATCRGTAPCVLDELPPRLGGVRLAVEMSRVSGGLRIQLTGNRGASFDVQEVTTFGRRLWRQQRGAAYLLELPAVLRIQRYEDYGATTNCLEQRYLCSRPRRQVGYAYLRVRALTLATQPDTPPLPAPRRRNDI